MWQRRNLPCSLEIASELLNVPDSENCPAPSAIVDVPDSGPSRTSTAAPASGL